MSAWRQSNPRLNHPRLDMGLRSLTSPVSATQPLEYLQFSAAMALFTSSKAILQAAHLECVLAALKHLFNELPDRIRVYGTHVLLRNLRSSLIRIA